jgi:hypothetical protein
MTHLKKNIFSFLKYFFAAQNLVVSHRFDRPPPPLAGSVPIGMPPNWFGFGATDSFVRFRYAGVRPFAV